MWVPRDLHCDGGLPTVWINCWLSPVMYGRLNFTLLQIEVGSLDTVLCLQVPSWLLGLHVCSFIAHCSYQLSLCSFCERSQGVWRNSFFVIFRGSQQYYHALFVGFLWLLCGCYVVAMRFLFSCYGFATLEFHWYPWRSIRIHLDPFGPVGIHLHCFWSICIHWDPLGSIGIHWDPLGSIWIYWDLLG